MAITDEVVELKAYSLSTFIYKGIFLDCLTGGSCWNKETEYRSQFTINMTKNNTFEKSQIETIFINIDYIIDIIKSKVLTLFNSNDEESFECKFDQNEKHLIFSIIYIVEDSTNTRAIQMQITKSIIDVLLNAAKELKNDNTPTNLEII